jgi:hypothetical protein
MIRSLIPASAQTARVVARAVLPKPARRWIYERGTTTRLWMAQRQVDRDARRVLLQHVRPTDTFIVAHAKSGNTWLAYMLAVLLRKDRDGRVNLQNLDDYVPFIPSHTVGRIADHSSLADPRLFRSEVPVHAELFPRVLYLIRDPRAVLVSYYHMYRTFFGDTQTTPREFVTEYLTRGCIVRWERQIRWDRHVLAWFRLAHRTERVLVVRYEDMVADRAAVLERAARFVRIPHTREDLAAAVARGSFEAMRKSEEEHGVQAYTAEQARRGRFVRRGQTEGWRDEFPPDVVADIERTFAPAMAVAGYR